VTEEATSEDEVLSGVTIDNLILGKRDPLAIWAALYVYVTSNSNMDLLIMNMANQ
jgi:hypothetical protein